MCRGNRRQQLVKHVHWRVEKRRERPGEGSQDSDDTTCYGLMLRHVLQPSPAVEASSPGRLDFRAMSGRAVGHGGRRGKSWRKGGNLPQPAISLAVVLSCATTRAGVINRGAGPRYEEKEGSGRALALALALVWVGSLSPCAIRSRYYPTGLFSPRAPKNARRTAQREAQPLARPARPLMVLHARMEDSNTRLGLWAVWGSWGSSWGGVCFVSDTLRPSASSARE